MLAKKPLSQWGDAHYGGEGGTTVANEASEGNKMRMSMQRFNPKTAPGDSCQSSSYAGSCALGGTRSSPFKIVQENSMRNTHFNDNPNNSRGWVGSQGVGVEKRSNRIFSGNTNNSDRMQLMSMFSGAQSPPRDIQKEGTTASLKKKMTMSNFMTSPKTVGQGRAADGPPNTTMSPSTDQRNQFVTSAEASLNYIDPFSLSSAAKRAPYHQQ